MEKRRRIKLLGDPAILDGEGRRCELRGQQAFAVLARVLLSPRPLDRRQLAGELFAETADPLGTLRWCLAALRRALDDPGVFRGDPIEPGLPPGIEADVLRIDVEADRLGHGELLEAVELRAGLTFSTWLLIERQRIAARLDERLRHACLGALARGDMPLAIACAEDGIRRNPYDEAMHVLLVKSLAAAGHADAAAAHVEAAERSFRDELGVAPSAALRSAARGSMSAPPAGVSRRAHARSLLDAGKAALGAGAVDAGVETLRRAASEAEKLDDPALRAEALLELGTALVHAVRGHDDEGAVLLRQAAVLAGEAGLADVQAASLRELGYVEALAGRRPPAAACLAEALALAVQPDRLAGIHSVIGFNLVDWGDIARGVASYETALDLARRAGNRRREAWCLGVGARGLIAGGDFARAVDWLDTCLAVVDDLRWVSFRPWSLALKGEVLLALGESPAALRPELENAYAMSCELQDPCWEGATGRSIALSYEREGRLEEALHWLGRGLTGTRSDVNRFAAQQVDLLEDHARVLRQLGRDEQAGKAAQEWIAHAARAHMDASVNRAAVFITGRA